MADVANNETINNTVTFTGWTVNANIYGGENNTNITGNTLNIGTASKRVVGLSTNGIYNFENINFYLPNTVNNGDIALSLKYNVDLSKSNIVVYLNNPLNLKQGDIVHIIKTNGTLNDPLSTSFNMVLLR